MKRGKPWALFVCGVNGAGKSSSARVLASNLPKLIIDPDALALAHGAAAGRVALKMFEAAVQKRADFCLESTLSGEGTLNRMRECAAAGYWVEMIYVRLKSLALHNERIARRVALGGHFIAPEVVVRRFAAAGRQLARAVRLCDQVSICDNSKLLKREEIYLKGRLIWSF